MNSTNSNGLKDRRQNTPFDANCIESIPTTNENATYSSISVQDAQEPEIYYYPTKVNWNNSWPKIIAIRTKEMLYLTYRFFFCLGKLPDGMVLDEDYENSWQSHIPAVLSGLYNVILVGIFLYFLFREWNA